MRPLWKGSISFGLVNIPVSLYPATRSARKISFDMLRESDHSPIHYKRVAEKDGKEVPWGADRERLRIQKGRHVVLTEEDFKRIEIKSNANNGGHT